MKNRFGYGEPLPARYLALARAGVGTTSGCRSRTAVSVLDADRAARGETLILSVAALLVTWLLAIPLGVVIAVRRGMLLGQGAVAARLPRHVATELFLAFLLLRLALPTGWFPGRRLGVVRL